MKRFLLISFLLMVIILSWLVSYAESSTHLILRIKLKSGYYKCPYWLGEIRDDNCAVDCETGVITVDDMLALIDLMHDKNFKKLADDACVRLIQDMVGRVLWRDEIKEIKEIKKIHNKMFEVAPWSHLHKLYPEYYAKYYTRYFNETRAEDLLDLVDYIKNYHLQSTK